ncbi:hypothetical protein [Fodinicola acaciae]|uniref:hypothetical protein n=1 Tax=Fodinicola acaciae TaxID=2681555 RepID=UPI0013D8A018|nr:hypothetical protein [Fodinicola acaciae]
MRTRGLLSWRGALLVLAALILGGAVGWALNDLIPTANADPSGSPRPTPSRAATDGHLTFTLEAFGCGLTAVQGTHSEGEPTAGAFCRLRLRVDNHDPDFHDYVYANQRLTGVPAANAKPDAFAMAVRRQVDRITIGGHSAVEVELWFDIPKTAKPTGLLVSGDNDPSGFRGDGPSLHKPGGVSLRATPADLSPR